MLIGSIVIGYMFVGTVVAMWCNDWDEVSSDDGQAVGAGIVWPAVVPCMVAQLLVMKLKRIGKREDIPAARTVKE